MSNRTTRKICERALAIAFTGAMIAGSSSAFADDANTVPAVGSTISANAFGNPAAAAVSQDDTTGAPGSKNTQSFLSGVASKAGSVVVGALNMIGVRYQWGGNSPDSGLDCSGFVRYVFRDTLGMTLPRRAEEMSQMGEKVKMTDLKPGDLVFFNTMRRTFSHVGIYIGDNKFVHSPSTGSKIRVDELDDSYWEKRFTGARRVETTFSGDDLKASVSRLTATPDAE
ncbi:C40 family peptidase [Pararobbsia silviterrae]|uniref:Peptidoglycan endopeptidase n=1 Tax=Pararobbsia silviterrae TaxID=1792498 RepID=A0A494XXW2_9BURK|nr:C40 family peptidase [Pararobbsia silviterrae]RKP54574.1 peptidoglycan endopeptidase [Pararobbsia silviterrae]